MYTVNVGTPDPRFGNMLLEQFGGANGELAAAMQYSIQGWNCDDPERKDMLMDIGTNTGVGRISGPSRPALGQARAGAGPFAWARSSTRSQGFFGVCVREREPLAKPSIAFSRPSAGPPSSTLVRATVGFRGLCTVPDVVCG